MTAQHLPLSELADHVTNKKLLDAAGLQHVDSCPNCRSDVKWLEALGSLRRFEPPKSAVDTVVGYFKQQRDAA
ncbi:MAG: hypothetical protein AUG12_05155 [Acidobacteria bacterium 13_1_20CM_2_57_8]|nr:MAG: hypothetical protein AUG12_05155 [Acidobacteria bacterium 13_1_20CM_2_57_8]